MTTEQWVRKLNALAREIEQIEQSVHPAVADTLTRELRDKYMKLAKQDHGDA